MDEVVLRRVVGVITLAIAAFLLSWLLPRPGLDRLRGEGERVVTVDLTRPDARPQELSPPSGQDGSPADAAPADAAPASDPPAKPASVPAAPQATDPAPTAVDSKVPDAAGKPTIASAPPESPRTVETPKPAVPSGVTKPTKPTEPTKPAAEAPTASPPSGGGSGQVMVQAGAYSHLDKAETVRERAGAQGQRCTISPAETAKGTLYRLRCGPYADRAQAQAAVKTLTAAGIGAQVVGGGR